MQPLPNPPERCSTEQKTFNEFRKAKNFGDLVDSWYAMIIDSPNENFSSNHLGAFAMGV